MSADLSLDYDDFEVIERGVESIYPPLEPSLNSSLVMPPPMLASTTTLVGQEDTMKDEMKDMQITMQNASLASSGSSTDRDLQHILRMQTETIDEMEEALNALPGLHARVGELTTRNEELETELQQTRAEMVGLKEAARKQSEEERCNADRFSSLTAELDAVKREKKEGEERAQETIKALERDLMLEKTATKQFKVVFEKENTEKLRKNDDTISSLLQKVAFLEQEKIERDRAQRCNVDRFSALTAELEGLKREKKEGEDRAQETIKALERDLMQEKTATSQFREVFDKENTEKLRKNDDTISSLLQKVAGLEQEMFERERAQEQLLQRTASLGEVEKLRGDNAALLRQVADLNQHVSEYMVENQRAIEGMMAKTDECERQMHKIRALESDLSKHRAETADNEAIIATLKEVNEEGSKMLEENKRQMDGMKRTLERYGHFHD